MTFTPLEPLKIYASEMYLSHSLHAFSLNEDLNILDPDISIYNIDKPYVFYITIVDFRVIERKIDGVNRFIVEYGYFWEHNATGRKEKCYEPMRYKHGHQMIFSNLKLAELLINVAKKYNKKIIELQEEKCGKVVYSET